MQYGCQISVYVLFFHLEVGSTIRLSYEVVNWAQSWKTHKGGDCPQFQKELILSSQKTSGVFFKKACRHAESRQVSDYFSEFSHALVPGRFQLPAFALEGHFSRGKARVLINSCSAVLKTCLRSIDSSLLVSAPVARLSSPLIVGRSFTSQSFWGPLILLYSSTSACCF